MSKKHVRKRLLRGKRKKKEEKQAYEKQQGC
jgi:hypothetical protein